MSCPTTGLVEPYQDCTVGHYCVLGAVTPNPSSESYGYLCPVGHYCPSGTPSPVPCPRGYYQPGTSKGVCQITRLLM